MTKLYVSIIIPIVGDVKLSPLLKSFKESGQRDLYIQFIFLENLRYPGPTSQSSCVDFEKGDSFEVLIMHNDRYFGTCEENLYRVSDILGGLFDNIFCVGEHDAVDWKELFQALTLFRQRGLDVMGWNINGTQIRTDGTYTSLPAIAKVKTSSLANDFVNMLMNGAVLSSDVAYPALISLYGPIDWAAYLGNSLFKKEVFRKVLSFKFSESVYSFVYKQLKFFSTAKIKYGFFSNIVISRIAEDFNKGDEPQNKFGWLEEHRRIKGSSRCFWITNLQYLVELRDASLFNLVSNSLFLSHQTNAQEQTIQYRQSSALLTFNTWCSQVMSHSIKGESFYLKEKSANECISDLRTVRDYLTELMNQFQVTALYRNYNNKVFPHYQSISSLLGQYMFSPAASGDILEECISQSNLIINQSSQEEILSMNRTSFYDYLNYIKP